MIGHLLWEIKKTYLFHCYPQLYNQWQSLSYFEFLLQNFLCTSDYTLLIMRLVFFIPSIIYIYVYIVFTSPQIKIYALGLYTCFKAFCTLFMN